MTQVKKPRDHKAKSAIPEPAQITVEVRGVGWMIDAAALDDWDLIEELNDATGASLPSAMRRLLGAEQNEKARELVRDPTTGRVPATAMSTLLGEIFSAVRSGNL